MKSGSKKEKTSNKKVIGRLEYIDIPEFDLYKITAKIDSGAYRGALHVDDVKEIEENGIKKLEFHITDKFHPELKNNIYKTSKFKFKIFKSAKVKAHKRYVIPLKIKIGGKMLDVELSLVDRSRMKYPVLIGRRALKNFLIDVDKKN